MFRCRTLLCTGMWVLLLAACQKPSPPPPATPALPAIVGGGCEGCERMFAGMPDTLRATHTSPGWQEGRQKLMLTGRVLKADGISPAPHVIVYYWHTDDRGLYTSGSDAPAPDAVHGRLRGWIRTGDDGIYTIRTSVPAAYPSGDNPQHIHLSIQEPGLPNPYFADLYFEGDPLYPAHREKYGQLNRCGSEVLHLHMQDSVAMVQHDLLLGHNIPHYPRSSAPR